MQAALQCPAIMRTPSAAAVCDHLAPLLRLLPWAAAARAPAAGAPVHLVAA
jgi:hypothetical protein